MINARKNVLTGLLLLSFSGVAFAATNSVSGMSQQELNKLGQEAAKDTKAVKDFKVSDTQLKEIEPEYAKTDLVSTYDPNNPAYDQGSAKKWQCLSFTDAQIQGFYKSSDAAEKRLAAECDPIRAAEKTNDKMDGRYGDPLENELVRLFTERQNEAISNSAKGDVNISCSPLASDGGDDREESCTIGTLPVEKTCVRTLKVVCYNKETGKPLTGNETCGTDKLPKVSVSSLGNFNYSFSNSDYFKQHSYTDYTASEAPEDKLKNTVTGLFSVTNLGNLKSRTVKATYTFYYDPKEHGTPFLKHMKLINSKGDEGIDERKMFVNGQQVAMPVGKNQSYEDLDGSKLLFNNLIKEGVNTIELSSRLKRYMVTSGGGGMGGTWVYVTADTYQFGIGFISKCVEAVCTENWDETCVDRGFLDPNDATDIDTDQE